MATHIQEKQVMDIQVHGTAFLNCYDQSVVSRNKELFALPMQFQPSYIVLLCKEHDIIILFLLYFLLSYLVYSPFIVIENCHSPHSTFLWYFNC
jgi:hypothetical protein